MAVPTSRRNRPVDRRRFLVDSAAAAALANGVELTLATRANLKSMGISVSEQTGSWEEGV